MNQWLIPRIAALVRLYYQVFYRVRVMGHPIPDLSQGPVIVAGNHVSMNDPVLLSAFLSPSIRFMAKEELFRVPGLCWLIRKMGAFPVVRRGIGIGAIRKGLAILRAGGMVGIFPEGTRNHGGPLLPAKPGVGFLAVRTGAVIVPVAITLRPRRIFRRNEIRVGQPIVVTSQWKSDYRALARHVLATVDEMLQVPYSTTAGSRQGETSAESPSPSDAAVSVNSGPVSPEAELE
ncbi:MAG: 1-acyl-sn-glycerol-3-phosphate acyltransferase [Alicyclobacillus herbarius]|uniref:lysophospholipid acyltransferase family protein n=1 Tax=Alicyclobacillus herbarius TaxID=122960 RepID=UPI0023555D5A|nr:lysophospholipid acyltransferase family protein [Alicyclobacillus herbarius]MCL6633690.1 1-acyl-sn-glycerol-3-phosphate acyltransferase [Alicyclobacillus herbarius]